MKRASLIIALFLGGCYSGHRPPLPFNTPPGKLPPPAPSVPDRGGIDPLQTDQIAEQSHVYPFLCITLFVMAICLLPLLWIAVKPHLPRVYEYGSLKVKNFKDWVKKKFDKRKD